VADVFLSYRSEENGIAGAIAGALEAEGVSVWWAGRLVGGANFQTEIHQQLTGARCVVVLWSQAAVRSDWVVAEAMFALDRKVLVPIKIGAVILPPPFNIRHTIDLIGWTGDRTHSSWKLLLAAVRQLATANGTQTSTEDRIIASLGHLIHKLKAKDTAGRWVHYFVYVPKEREVAFAAELNKGKGIIDLDQLGVVIASNYGEEPNAEIKYYLKAKYGFDV